jgi:transcriptional regulator with XRE-family HTH domain
MPNKAKKPVEVIKCEVESQIETVMRSRGLTLEELGRRARITSRQLHRIIHGENCPSLERAHALSVVLDQPIDKLFRFHVKKREVML